MCNKCEDLPANIVPDGLLLMQNFPICQSTVMTPIRLEEGTSVTHRATSPDQPATQIQSEIHLDDPALHCVIYSCLISIIMPETLELLLMTLTRTGSEDANVYAVNEARYRNTGKTFTWGDVQWRFSVLWMTNNDKWRLLYLIDQWWSNVWASHLSFLVAAEDDYLFPGLCLKSAGRHLASKCPICSTCVCTSGWLGGLLFSRSSEVRWKDWIFYGWSSAEGSKDVSLCCERKSRRIQLKVNNSNSICHSLHGGKIKTDFFFLIKLKAYSSFALTAAYFHKQPFHSAGLSVRGEQNSETSHFMFFWLECFNSVQVIIIHWFVVRTCCLEALSLSVISVAKTVTVCGGKLFP